MSTTIKEKIVDAIVDRQQNRNLWNQWYRKNASAVHGVEPDSPPAISVAVPDAPAVKSPPVETTTPITSPVTHTQGPPQEQQGSQPSTAEDAGSAWSSWLKPLGLGLLGATIGAVSSGGYSYYNSSTSTNTPSHSLSLEDDLQGRGYHLPESVVEE